MKQALTGFLFGFILNILFNTLWYSYLYKMDIFLNKTWTGFSFFFISLAITLFIFKKQIFHKKE